MIPFLSAAGTSLHLNKSEVEVVSINCKPSGGALGPERNIKGVKTEFARGPGRGDTCHLSDLDETLPDWRDYQTILKDKVGRLCDFSLKS